MSPLPKPPAETGDRAACRSLDGLAPAFRIKLARVQDELRRRGWQPCVRETTRSDARAAFLFGFGRDYDDDRGVVTNAATAWKTWHRYGLAADLGDVRYDDEHTPAAFWTDLEQVALAQGLTSGADWNRNEIHDEHFCDRPHVQWWCEGMHVTPSDHARALVETRGVSAVWFELRADA